MGAKKQGHVYPLRKKEKHIAQYQRFYLIVQSYLLTYKRCCVYTEKTNRQKDTIPYRQRADNSIPYISCTKIS